MQEFSIRVETDDRDIQLTVKIYQATAALVNSKFRFDVESFDLKFELISGNSNESTNLPLKLQNSSLGVSA